jgi:hypothetical protein
MPQTMGEDQPRPGMAVFHVMCWFSDQCKGARVASLRPSPVGPRKAGQSAAAAVGPQSSTQVSSIRIASLKFVALPQRNRRGRNSDR